MNKPFRGLFVGVVLATMGFVSSAFGADWTFNGSTLSDGAWSFAATVEDGALTVGAVSAAPEAVTALDFSKPITDGGSTTYKIVALNPAFGQAVSADPKAGAYAGKVGVLTMPSSDLVSIGAYAFCGCTNATGTMTFPETLTTVGECAFAFDSQLTFNAEPLPSGVKSIYNRVFAQCHFPDSVTFSYLTRLGAGAFRNSYIRNITFGAALAEIGGSDRQGAFNECTNLVSVTFNANSKINLDADFLFYGCKNLTYLDLRAVTNVVSSSTTGPFYGCTSLRHLWLGTLPSLPDNFFMGAASPADGVPFVTDLHFTGKAPKFAEDWRLPDPPTSWDRVQVYKSRMATFVHLDSKSATYEDDLASWKALTADGNLAATGTTWNATLAGSADNAAKRPLLLWQSPTITIDVENSVAADEGKEGYGYFLLTRGDDDPLETTIPINFTITGSATPGQTYCSIYPDIDLKAGEKSVKVKIRPLNDPTTTVDTDVTLTLDTDPNGYYSIGATSAATLAVKNAEKYGGYLYADAGKWNLLAHMGNTGLGNVTANTPAAAKYCVDHGYAFEVDVQWDETTDVLYLGHDAISGITADWTNTFQNVLKVLPTGAVFKVDAKCSKYAGAVEAIIAAIKEDKTNERAFLAINHDPGTMWERIHQEFTNVDTWSYSGPGTTSNPAANAAAIAEGDLNNMAYGHSYAWNEEEMTDEFFAEFNKRGITIDVWTIEDPRTIKELINRGARYITTNNPFPVTAALPSAADPVIVEKEAEVPAACEWTMELWNTNSWTRSAEALAGGAGANDQDGVITTDTDVGTTTEIAWEFSQPMDLTSLTLYTLPGSGRQCLSFTNGVLVKYKGASEYVKLADSERRCYSKLWEPQAIVFAGTNDTAFATNVVAIKLTPTETKNGFCEIAETVLLGTKSSGGGEEEEEEEEEETFEPGWNVRNYDAADYVQPETALSGTLLDTSSSQVDGDITTSAGLDSWYNRGLSFSSPKDITEVRIYPVGSSDTTCSLPNVASIDVMYYGSDTWTSLSGTGYGFDSSASWANCIQMVFRPTSGKYVAKRVRAIRIHHSGVGGDKRIAEYEFLGGDSFIPAFTASYDPGDSTLTATLTAKAQYPAQVWFCSGNTDGGTSSTNTWDRVIPAYVATSIDPVEDQRNVNFKYCRYCFESEDDGFIWSEGFIWTDEPAGTATISKCGSTLLKLNVSPSWCGGTNKSVDVYTAVVEHGGTMPEPQLKASGIARNGSVEVTIEGLSPETEYDWLVRIVNADGLYYDVTGTTTTATAGAMWFKDPYDYANWTVPSNWLSGFSNSGSALADGEVVRDLTKENQRSGINNNTYTWTFSSPKDIETMEILMNVCTLEVLGIEVKYAGDEDWTALSNSTLSYTDAPPSGTLRRGTFKIADGGYFVENVSAIRVSIGSCSPGHVGCCEMLVTGRDHAQVCRWEPGRVTADGYVPATDALSGMQVKDDSGCKSEALKTLFTNGDITDSSLSLSEYYNGGDVYWEFSEPMNLRQLRFVASTDGVYPNFGCSGVWVKYDGDDDYTLLEGSSFAAFQWSNSSTAPYLKLTGESKNWFARGVVAMKARIVVYNWRLGMAEIEVAGEPGVLETLTAEYEVSGRNLAATATPGAAEYPVEAYFCSGLTDGGTEGTNGWTSVTKVATLTSSSDAAEWNGEITFNCCRFCYWSKKYEEWVWSDLGDVRQAPSGSVAVGTVTFESAALTATLTDAGAPANAVDVYVACDTAADPSEYSLVTSGMAAGNHEFTLNDLAENTTYYYSVMFTNVSGKAVCYGGSFKTPWSPAELQRPDGSVSVSDIRSAQASVDITLLHAGEGLSVADIWLATWAHDGEEGALKRVATGVEPNHLSQNLVKGLSAGTAYDYRVVFSNSLDRTREYSGSFTTMQGAVVDPDTPVARDVPYRSLPTDYTQVEYLQSPDASSGKWWINTGLKSTATLHMDMECSLQSCSGDFVGQDVNDNADWRIYSASGRTIIDMGSSRLYDQYHAIPLDVRMQISMGAFKATVKTNGLDYISASASASTINAEDVYIFACNGTYGASSAYTKIWSCVMKEDDEVVRDFVPAVRNSDLRPGLYDVVNGVFYQDAGDRSYGLFRTGNTVLGMAVTATADYSFTTKEWTMTFDVTSGSGALYAVVQDADGNRKVALVKADAAAGDHIDYVLEMPIADEYQIGYKTIVDTQKDYTFLRTTHQKPVGEISYGKITKRSAEVVLTLTTAGELEPTSDLYFAYAKDGEELPALTKLASGVSTGAVITNLIEGLEFSTEYDCVLVCSNSVYGSRVESSFTTSPNWEWTTAEFDAAAFTPDSHWIAGGNGTITSYASVYADKYITWELARPQNVYSLALYSTDGGRNDLEHTGVQVQYYGSEDWVMLPSSDLPYTSSKTNNSRHRFDAAGDPIATNVVAVRVYVTRVENGAYSLYQSMLIGEPADADTVSWSVTNVTAAAYSRPKDCISPSDMRIVSMSGFDATEIDGDITTSYAGADYEHSGRQAGHEYEWNFKVPFKIREIQLYSNGANANETAFCVSDVYVKHSGDAEYTRLDGSSFEILKGNPTDVRFARLVSRSGEKFAMTDIVALKVVLGSVYSSKTTGAHIAEVQLCGRGKSGFVISVH